MIRNDQRGDSIISCDKCNFTVFSNDYKDLGGRLALFNKNYDLCSKCYREFEEVFKQWIRE